MAWGLQAWPCLPPSAGGPRQEAVGWGRDAGTPEFMPKEFLN